ncbi:MAG: hypothetical protein QG606_215 [Patescibacteria group bacterium]|nr:hypothetical protein [Patescibacteria group bacterium]
MSRRWCRAAVTVTEEDENIDSFLMYRFRRSLLGALRYVVEIPRPFFDAECYR